VTSMLDRCRLPDRHCLATPNPLGLCPHLMAICLRLRFPLVAIALLFLQLGSGDCHCLHANLWFQTIEQGSGCDEHDHHPQEDDCDCSVKGKPSFVSDKQVAPERDVDVSEPAPATIVLQRPTAGQFEDLLSGRFLADNCLLARDRGALRAELGVYLC
jgi:hypothetical protein